jgi:hypothetical protein
VREIFTSTFRNGIIEGYNTKEFQLELDPGNTTDLFFDHQLIRTDESTTGANFGLIWKNQSPGFANGTEGDFHLGSLNAFAVDKGLPGTGVFEDLDGAARDAAPDLGCYEFVP